MTRRVLTYPLKGAPFPVANEESGFTLAELLLATSIAAVLAVAVLALFSGGVKTWQSLSATPRQESVQRALLALASDVRQSASVTAGRNRLVLQLSGGNRVRYRVLPQRDEDWLIRETLGPRAQWTWSPRWPLLRATRESLKLREETASDPEMQSITLQAGQERWNLEIWPRAGS